MTWGIRYIVQEIQLKIFEKLTIRIYDIEMIMLVSGIEGPTIEEPLKYNKNIENRANILMMTQAKNQYILIQEHQISKKDK